MSGEAFGLTRPIEDGLNEMGYLGPVLFRYDIFRTEIFPDDTQQVVGEPVAGPYYDEEEALEWLRKAEAWMLYPNQYIVGRRPLTKSELPDTNVIEIHTELVRKYL